MVFSMVFSMIFLDEGIKHNRHAFSLDVVSLYTSVPALPAVNLLTDCITSSNIYCFGLTAADIHKLLTIIVDNTFFNFNNLTYKQTSGLPMGSSLSGLLAITYMDQLERRALNTCRSCVFFTRYVDDILILTSSRGETNSIYETFEKTDEKISFSIEHPSEQGSLSLLDFQLRITEEGNINTNFYKKAACRDLFVHYRSALPTSAKAGYIRNELTRINTKSPQ